MADPMLGTWWAMPPSMSAPPPQYHQYGSAGSLAAALYMRGIQSPYGSRPPITLASQADIPDFTWLYNPQTNQLMPHSNFRPQNAPDYWQSREELEARGWVPYRQPTGQDIPYDELVRRLEEDARLRRIREQQGQ